MLKVTFDSNVWRIVASPNSFLKNPEIDAFRRINRAIASGAVFATVAETVFTLEAVERKGRREFLSAYSPQVSTTEEELPDGTIKISLAIGPDKSAHPGNSAYLSKHWSDAELLGFRVLHCPRVAGVVNPDMHPSWMLSGDLETANRFGACVREVEKHGAGIAQIKALGTKYNPNGASWLHGISMAAPSEDAAIASAVAEWADGDTVAAHYAYGNEYLCTNDRAKGAGAMSVFSLSNRTWLETSFNLRFINPSDLTAML